MRFLLIGGAGTIGYRLAPILRELGHDVFIMSHGRGLHSDEYYIRGDIMYIDDIRHAVRYSQVDRIVHLAAEVSRRGSEANLVKTATVNSIGTLNVALVAEEANIPMLFTSTSEVYGRMFDYGRVPVTEDMQPDPFNNMYALSKYHAEQQMVYLSKRNLRGSIARIFMTYGEGKFHRAHGNVAGIYSGLEIMATGLLMDKPIEVHENTARQWCYVDDTCRALIEMALRAKSMTSGGPPDIYNVGQPVLHQSLQVAKTLADILSKDYSLIKLVPCPPDTIPVKVASFEKIRRELGFEAKISLEAGLRRYINWLSVMIRR